MLLAVFLLVLLIVLYQVSLGVGSLLKWIYLVVVFNDVKLVLFLFFLVH